MIPLFENCLKFKNSVAIIDSDGKHTYKKLFDHAAEIAFTLNTKIEKSSKFPVLYLFPSGFNYVSVQWGIWMSGRIAVPLNTNQTPHEWEYFIKDTGTRLLIYAGSLEDKVRYLYHHKIKFRTLEDVLTGEVLNIDYKSMAMPSIDTDALMIYTSGTTGSPKGAVHTHRQIDAQIRSLSQAWEWSEKDRILNVLPMHHIHGIINITTCALFNGAMLEMHPKFEVSPVAERMTSGELTLFMAVPTIYYKLIQYFESLPQKDREKWQEGMKKMRLMVSGSASLPITILERWKEVSGHTLLERYGMTEIGMALSNPLNEERRPGYVGFPLPFVKVKLVDEKGTQIKKAGVSGELYVNGETVFKYYWNKPEATDDAFEKGWFKTGDIVEISKDGYYKILGRKSSDIIKSGGYKISALELENILLTNNKIRECAVVSIPDEAWGEIICTGIIGDTNEEDLKEWMKDKFASYKLPRRFIFNKPLPRNAMGKVLKKEIKNWFINR